MQKGALSESMYDFLFIYFNVLPLIIFLYISKVRHGFLYTDGPFRDFICHPSIRCIIRENLGQISKKCLKMYDSEALRKILPMKLSKHPYFRGETSFLTRKGPRCPVLLRLKGTLL